MSIRAIAVFLAIGCLAGTAAATDWHQYQADERNSGGYSGRPPLDPGRFVPVDGGVRSSVVPTDDALYAIDRDGVLHRYGAGNATELPLSDRWRSESKSPIVADGIVYIAAMDDGMVALHRNGSVAWHTPLEGRMDSTPAVGDARLYVGHGRNVTALDRADGERRWTTATDRPVATPVTLSDRVYVATVDDELRGRLVALDPTDGDILWRFSRPEVVSAPVVAWGTVFVADQGGTVHALQPSDGEPRWHRDVGNTTLSFPSAAEGSVFVGTADGTLYALARTDGSTRWRYDGRGRLFGTPAVVDGTVYAMNRAGWVGAVDALTGEERWTRSLSRSTWGSPTVVGDAVYVPTDVGITVVDQLRGGPADTAPEGPDGNDSRRRPSTRERFPGTVHLVGLSLALVVLLVAAHYTLSSRED